MYTTSDVVTVSKRELENETSNRKIKTLKNNVVDREKIEYRDPVNVVI